MRKTKRPNNVPELVPIRTLHRAKETPGRLHAELPNFLQKVERSLEVLLGDGYHRAVEDDLAKQSQSPTLLGHLAPPVKLAGNLR